MSTENKKDHADFQSKYNQSKNFYTEVKDESFKLKGDGELKMANEELILETDKEKIADAMDSMRRKIENTPGRISQREEEEE